VAMVDGVSAGDALTSWRQPGGYRELATMMSPESSSTPMVSAGNRMMLHGSEVAPIGGVSSVGELVATLPLPAVVVPDLAGVGAAGRRAAGRLLDRGRPRGRHAAPRPSLFPKVFDGSRFLLFSAIGGFVFVLGLGVQAWLTTGLRVVPMVSYLVQALLSIEASFLLNRWLTWRDRDTPFWLAFGRFNLQKSITVALNMVMYAGLLWLGMNYLLANIVLTAFFTVVNFVAGDRFVFVPAGSKFTSRLGERGETLTVPAAEHQAAVAASLMPPQPIGVATLERSCRPVSVVIPCRNNQATIGPAVRSALAQDYPGLAQIIVIGSPGDTSWEGLADITDPRLVTMEVETPPGLRDANYKRHVGILGASGDLIALVDSDIVLPGDWMVRAVAALEKSAANCVTGGMRSIHDTYWGRYTDSTRVGAKTPRIPTSYTVTKENFGMKGRKPPITANALFTRAMYDECPIDASWSHGSYEDYEWFWRVVSEGYTVEVCEDMFGWHHHRRGLRPLMKEYLRSSRGCAYFIWAHMNCPFARRRLSQAATLPFVGLAIAVATAGAIVDGYGAPLGVLAFAAAIGFAVDQIIRSRRLESLLYPLTGLALGLVYTVGLIGNLIRSHGKLDPTRAPASVAARQPQAYASPPEDLTAEPVPRQMPITDMPDQQTGPSISSVWLRAVPLFAICCGLVALSLTLIWSNTAFTDEASYLWVGRLVIDHWLHGASWPASYGDRILPGSPILYPPLGAIADDLGGLAGARILGLAFMLGATILLYFTSARLVGRASAIFAATLWVLAEPVIRLSFATPDPLAVFLTALSAWLIVEAGQRRYHGELVAAAALALAFANAASYSSTVIDPVLFAFAFFAWRPHLRQRQAAYSAAWLAGGWVVFLAGLLTISRSWIGFGSMAFAHGASNHQSIMLVFTDIWNYSGLLVVLSLIGVAIAYSSPGIGQTALVAVLGCAALVVPAVQILSQTAQLIDTRLAYGLWFSAIAIGLGCTKVIRSLPSAGSSLTAAICAVAIGYLGFSSWHSAWDVFRGWPNSKSFIAALAPFEANGNGLMFVAGAEHVAEYYTKQGNDWRRWSTVDLPLDPRNRPTAAYYLRRLRAANYGLIALFYSGSLTKASLVTNVLTSASPGQALSSAEGPNQPGLVALTEALVQDHAYRLVETGPYNSANDQGTYAIWREVSKK
jgi:putative flippase GtrA/GT2 family glycosyltransferase